MKGTTSMSILQVKNISKKIGKKEILKDITFEINKGDILAFIGPNGSGKTTTIKCILGLQKINTGEVIINGYDIRKDYIKAINESLNNVGVRGIAEFGNSILSDDNGWRDLPESLWFDFVIRRAITKLFECCNSYINVKRPLETVSIRLEEGKILALLREKAFDDRILRVFFSEEFFSEENNAEI